jgi:hypothetical protein
MFGIYRKPTATDTLTHNKSCLSNEHRLADINYLTLRLKIYTLAKDEKEKEENIIKMFEG